MSKKNADSIKAAAAEVGGNGLNAELAEAFVAPTPEPPYLFGSEVPEEVLRAMEFGRVNYVDVAFVSVRRGYNVRDYAARENIEHIANTVASISENGLENPIKVRIVRDPSEGNRIVVVNGETRLRAILKIREDKGPAAFPEVPVLLAPEKDEAGQTIDFVVDNSGKSLSLLENLTVVNRLKGEGLKPSEIARRLTFSHTTMRNLALLNFATPAMKETVRDGWLSASWLVEEIRKLSKDGADPEPEQLGLLEKKVLRLAEKRKAEGTGAAKGRQVADEGEEKEDARKQSEGPKIIFNRGTFNTLVSTLQDVLATLVPAKEFVKQRKMIRSALENCGAPLVNPAAKKVAAEVAAAEEAEEVA